MPRIKRGCGSAHDRWQDAKETYEEAQADKEDCWEGCKDRNGGTVKGCRTRCSHHFERVFQAAKRLDKAYDDFLDCQEGRQADRVHGRRKRSRKAR